MRQAGEIRSWHCYVLSGEAKKSLTGAILNSSGMSPNAEFKMYPTKDDMPPDLYDVYMKQSAPCSCVRMHGSFVPIKKDGLMP